MKPNPQPDTEALRRQLEAASRLHRQGRLAQAETAYRSVLDHAPEHPEVLRLLGLLKVQAGDAASAIDLLGRAVAAGSGDGRALEALGCVLGRAGRRDDAIRCLREAVAVRPRQRSARVNLGMLLMDDPSRLDEAVEAFEQVLAPDSDDATVRGALGIALLRGRQPRRALEHIEWVLARRPGDVHALAHKCAALSQLGDDAGVAALVDLRSMLHIERFAGGGGFAEAAALNARLATLILGHPTLGAERTTTNGMDTDEILDADDPAIRALVGFVEAAVERMIGALDLAADHPFFAGRPERWYLSGWGVRMWRGGFQIPHYHKDAWISGVYYVQLPPVVRRPGTSQAGWIEFGRGRDDIYQQSRSKVRRVRPEEGMLIAFPSYFWHRTLPFDDDHERLCISFNVVPADG